MIKFSSLVIAIVMLLCGCQANKTADTTSKVDALAKIMIDGKEIDGFDNEKLSYEITLSNTVLTQPKITAENSSGNADGIKYKYPETIEGVYMIKYKGVIYEMNMQYEKAPNDLSNSFYRLTRDKELNIAYFGGSVTSGYGSSSTDKRWASLVTQHIKSKFSDANINELNAAIGGTGTAFGAYRAVADMKLESYKPDLVFIEFAINDIIDNTEAVDSKKYLETIIRTVYTYSPNANIVLVFITSSGSKGEDFGQLKAHREIAEQYNIPCVNVGKALCAEIDKYLDMNYVDEKHPEWLKYFIDTVHPNDAGYAKYASYIINYLDKVFYQGREVDAIIETKYPEKSVTETLIKPEMFNAVGKGNIGNFSVSNEGYLRTSTDGSTLTLKFTGNSLKMWCFAGPMSANVEYSIDGNELKSISMKKDSQNHKIFVFADNLTDTEHTVKMTFKKNLGAEVDIRYFLITGNTEGKDFKFSN